MTGASASAKASSTRPRVSSSDPDVAIRRVACGGQPLHQVRALCAGPARDVIGRHASVDQALLLLARAAFDQPDLVTAGRKATLDELDGLDDHERVAGRSRAVEEVQHTAPDVRMGDRLEIRQRRRIGEDDAAQALAIERAVGAENRVAEALADGGRATARPEP